MLKIENIIDLSDNPKAHISQEFGVPWVRNPLEVHNGVDIAGLSKFTKVFATGKIIKAGYHFDDPIHAFGNRVAVQFAPGLGLWLCHFDGIPDMTRTGKQIENELVGFVGSSGSSLGTHLHIGVKDLITGRWYDPKVYINLATVMKNG